MMRYGSKTDPRMIYQQNLSTGMFVSYKVHKNSKISYIQREAILGEVDTRKKQSVLLYRRSGRCKYKNIAF